MISKFKYKKNEIYNHIVSYIELYLVKLSYLNSHAFDQ
jgi:hypothetical protein